MEKESNIGQIQKVKPWHSSIHFLKTVTIFGYAVKFEMRKNDGWMGRLGGGWAWKLGILASRNDVVFELFVMSIRITKRRNKNKK